MSITYICYKKLVHIATFAKEFMDSLHANSCPISSSKAWHQAAAAALEKPGAAATRLD